MSAETWMEDRANSDYDFDFACTGRCETGKREARLEEINEAIAEATNRNLHMPISILAERDALISWLNENAECTC